jgi:hypothetical protein
MRSSGGVGSSGGNGDSSGKDRGIESRYYTYIVCMYMCMLYIYVYMGSILPVGTEIPPGRIGVLNPGVMYKYSM